MAQDKYKTKAQLIEELVELRKKCSEDTEHFETGLRSTLIEALPYPTMLIRKDRTILFANKTAREVGAVPGGLCWRDFGHSNYIFEEQKTYINEHDDVPEGIHCTFCQADDALGTQSTEIAPEIEAFGRLWEIHWVPVSEDVYLHYAQDVTERKRAKEALKDSEERLKSILDNSNDVIALVNAEGKLTYLNPSAKNVSGYDNEERVGASFLDLVHPEDLPKVKKAFARTMASSKAIEKVELRLHHKDGSWRWVEGTGKNFLDVRSLKSIVFNYHDINERKLAETERLKLQAKVQQAQKLESLSVLAGGVAHDFNNLLMGIIGNADLALMDLTPEATARQSLVQINMAAKRAADLSRQMLAYSGRGHFVVQRMNLQTLIEEMAHLLEAAVSKKIVLKFDFAKNVPLVDADAAQMRQIVMNLVANASEAIDDRSGVISIRTGAMECNCDYLSETYLDNDLPEGVYSYIEVSDTGCGIDNKNISKIFEPFFSTKFVGRGLGLAATLGIVRGHNGAIKVYSETDKGTTSKILLPALLDASDSSIPPESSIKKSALDGKVVMLVDDEETVRTVSKEMLKRLGIKVTTAENGREALKLFKQDPDRFDCILLDLTMPHMGGEETFREMRLIRKDVCVLLSSGYNENEVKDIFAGKKLSGYIQKPYRSADIAKALVKALYPD